VNIKRVGITSKPNKPEVGEIVPTLLNWLCGRGLEVFIDQETAATLRASAPSPIEGMTRPRLASTVDLVIVLGGDGTFLATARALEGRPVPVLAVNLGGLGFLTVVTREEIYLALESVLAGRFRLESRVQLETSVVRAGQQVFWSVALNDVVLNKGAIARVLDFDAWSNEQFISTYKADGLIVATPTGSTAYSLAAGGPVVDPNVRAFIITPICAHTLTNRPIVLRDNVTIEVAVKTDESVYVTVDGQVAIEVYADDRVRIRKAESTVQVIQALDRSYYDILREKLKWGHR
jgi:NAD+ kinase